MRRVLDMAPGLRFRRVLGAAVFLLCFSSFNPDGFSAREQIQKIQPDGVFIFASGRQARLAGLEVSPEGIKLLAALLAGKQVDVEPEPLMSKPGGGDFVYLYVENEMLPLPFKDPLSERKSEHVMVNRFLVAVGGARVLVESPFREQEEFLKIEVIARDKGEGIWSYDTSANSVGHVQAA